MKEQEKKLREARTIEATRKGYMGINGKPGLIARFLGQPIMYHSEGGGMYNSTSLEDPWSLPEEEDKMPGDIRGGTAKEVQSQIPYMNLPFISEPSGGSFREERDYEMPEVSTHSMGHHFDGLNRGLHMEIWLLDGLNEIKVYFQGHLVFMEVGGELMAYNPTSGWEEHVERLSLAALKIQRDRRGVEQEQKKQQAQRKKATWLEGLRERWGI